MNFVNVTEPEVIPVKRCDILNFGSNYRSLFENKQVNLSACIPIVNKILRGNRTYDYYSYYLISFYPCVNSTKNNFTCKEPLTLTRLLTKFGINFKMQDIELTPQNYKNPIQYRMKELTLPSSNLLLSNVYAYAQLVNIETDEDIIGFEDKIKKKQYLKYDEAQILSEPNSVNYYNNERKPLATFTITLSENELTQTRTYPKLITVLGDVGGLMEIMFSFFKVISAFVTEGLYRKSLVNHLFSFDLNKKLILINDKKLKESNQSYIMKTLKSDKIDKKEDLIIYNNNSNNNKNNNNAENCNLENINSKNIYISKNQSSIKTTNKKAKMRKNLTTFRSEDKSLSNNKSYKTRKLIIISKQKKYIDDSKNQDLYKDMVNEKEGSKKRLFHENNIEIIANI